MAPPKHIVPATAKGVKSVEEEDSQHNTAIVDASIAEPSSVIEEAALIDLKKNLEESVTRPEEEAPEQELTLRDLPEIQKGTAEDDATSVKTTIEKPLIVQQCLESTSVHKQPVIVLALEKPDSDAYLHFTPPLFDLLSQDQLQQVEIHGEQIKAAGPIKEPSSQEFGEEIIYTQGTLDRFDKEMNDMQMKIAEKKLERILKLREELRELENSETPQKLETSRTRIYNWATQCTNTNQYGFLFNFKTGKAYQAMRDHFMSLDREDEMDLVNGMLAAYNHNYFDPQTELPYSIRTLTENDNNEGLHYIDKDKMKRARYEQLEEFREQIVERILCDVDNEFREMVMEVAKPNTRHPRPSCALQSLYIQLELGDLKLN
ncbi:hypothetical protein PIB30_047882 [Stylosanthes scabra]|uniref:Uncharacterized protein n=1 Tax=Stylosanthes scabra TaxID=79078 RepID=A0ABU6YFN0_9FABA|nr:hypothetical protein [Stylosanthes scabra]